MIFSFKDPGHQIRRNPLITLPLLTLQPETPATTPEDEDVSMSEGGSGRGAKVPASKPKTKVKPVEVEATTTEKEHVNVVFIGHVGRLLPPLSCVLFLTPTLKYDFKSGHSKPGFF